MKTNFYIVFKGDPGTGKTQVMERVKQLLLSSVNGVMAVKQVKDHELKITYYQPDK